MTIVLWRPLEVKISQAMSAGVRKTNTQDGLGSGVLRLMVLIMLDRIL